MKGLSSVNPLRLLRATGLLALWVSPFVLIAIAVFASKARADSPAAAAPTVTITTSEAQPSAASASPDAAKKPEGEKPAEGEKKPDGENKDKKPDEKSGDDKSKDKKDDSSPIRRPEKPEKPADPAELKVKPDEKGNVSFSFKGQPWQGVLEWLADVSHLSLDWQEVPAGFLDLTTRRKYSLDEARDMINSILLSKGYTLLRNGEVLIVTSLKNLDVSLVPIVAPSQLNERGTFELVRTFFDLERLQAEPLVEELKPLLSPYAKINALKTTNRLDILETAGNLRRIRDIIGAEQGESGKAHSLRAFRLRHARVDDVLVTLKQLLGIQDRAGGPGGGGGNFQELQQQMQQQQQMLQQIQQQQGQGDKKASTKQQQEDKVYLAINRRENSIMALATPDKLAVIEQAVGLLDVPSDSNATLASLQRVQIYRLVAADPLPIVNVLKELGNLDPATRLEVDNINKAIIVSGPLVDHVTVRTLLEKLDGSARRFEVIQLHKLDADYVAGSIEFLLRGPPKDTNRPRYVFGDYRTADQGKDGGFQVEADTKNNRLLLRVNDIEMEEIRKLMIKLGEDPFGNAQGDNMRIIHTTPSRDTSELLEKLKRIWPTISPNPLQLDVPAEESPEAKPRDNARPRDRNETTGSPSANKSNVKTAQPTDEKSSEPEDKSQRKPAAKVSPTATATLRSNRVTYVSADAADSALADNDSSPADDAQKSQPVSDDSKSDSPPVRPSFRHFRDGRGDEPASTTIPTEAPPPISITKGPQGLIVTSRDAATLDQFMKLIDQLSPNDTHYHVFNLNHAYARDVVSLLEGIFSEDVKKQQDGFTIRYFFDESPQDEKKERNRLSKRLPLRFTADPVTNTILVQNADDEQLAKIQSLINIYDRPESPDSQAIRRTKIVHVNYAKAQSVADVLKEVYRDLLSPNDKALATNNNQNQQQQRQFYSIFDMGPNKTDGSSVPRFKGLLSVGVDATSNSLVVSAPQFLLTDVLGMITRLDESTKPAEPVVRVVGIGGGMLNDPIIMDALKSIGDPEAAKRNANSQSRRNDDPRNRRGSGNNRGPWGNNNNNNNNGNNNGGNNNNNNQQNNNNR